MLYNRGKYERGSSMYDEDEVDIADAMKRRAAWVSKDDLAALGLERSTGLRTTDGGPESHTDQANRILREAAPMAASSLVRIAQYGETEQARLKASIEILNRVAAQGSSEDGRDPWAGVYEAVLTTQGVENYANRKA
jgi:hypothetical protein